MRRYFYFSFFLLSLFFLFSLSTPLFAQNDVDYIEDEGSSLWDEEIFSDSVEEEGVESEFDSSSGQYISEEEAISQERRQQSSREPARDLAAAIDQDKDLGLENLKYGIFTGLTLGGWFALWQGSSARDNARYLGMGIVLGSLLGVSIGFKTVITPPNQSVHLMPSKDRDFLTPPPTRFLQAKTKDKASINLLNYSFRF